MITDLTDSERDAVLTMRERTKLLEEYASICTALCEAENTVRKLESERARLRNLLSAAEDRLLHGPPPEVSVEAPEATPMACTCGDDPRLACSACPPERITSLPATNAEPTP